MLAADCPSCGAPVPVSLVAPDLIGCASCRYQGPPHPRVSEQLRAAAAALWQMDVSDRQLSDAQRFNVRTARSYVIALFVVLSALLLPLMLLASGCTVFIATGEHFDVMSLVLIVCGLLPFALGVGVGGLALRHLRRRGRALEARCAAAPPVAEGQPARCHVCGGPLEVPSGRAIVRCAHCQADNLISKDILARIGVQHAARAGQIAEQVRGEASALDKSALSTGGLAVATALLAPALGFVLFVAVVITAVTLETGPIPDAVYAFVPVTNTRCIARVVAGPGGTLLDFELNKPLSSARRTPAPAGLSTLRGAELVGRELMVRGSGKGKLTRLYRTALARSIDYADIDVGGRRESTPIVGLCEPSSRRRMLGRDERLENATRMRASGDELFVSSGRAILDVPKNGGPPSLALEARGGILDFQRRGAGFVVLAQAEKLGGPNCLELYEAGKTVRLAEALSAFALDGDDVLVGKDDGLYRRDAKGNLTQVDATPYVSAISVEKDAVYWSTNRGFVFELAKASGRVRRVGEVMAPVELARVGSYVYASDKVLKATFLPLAGGDKIDLAGNGWIEGAVRTDGKAAYLPLASSDGGGVVAVVPGRPDALGGRHYGIGASSPKAFAVDGGEVFWVDGTVVMSEPVVAL